MYITHYSRTIHGQYTHNKRTIPITSVEDRYKFISTFIFNLCNSVKEILGFFCRKLDTSKNQLQRYNKIFEFPNFYGYNFFKNIYISRRMRVTVCNNSFYVAFLFILILVIRDSRTAGTANFYVSSARMQGRKFKNSCPCCPSVPL